MDILDQILAEDRAKAYSDRKGGYTRKYGPDISWNGDTTGRFVLDDHFVLVSETAIDLTKVESIMMKSQNDDSSLVFDAGELTVEVVDENTSTITPKNVNNIICASSVAKDYTADDGFGNVHDYKKGTYFYFDESIYISYVKMKETIVPIDPKFLPGVCLPVVEIADITAITAEESALLTAAIGSPIVVATDTSKIVCSYAFADDNYVFFGYTMGGNIISVDGTNWAFVTE